MDGRERVLLIEMVVNTAIATAWAVAATMAARREGPLRWPAPWRWVVANWMWWKAGLFGLIVASFFVTIGFPVAEAVVGGFTAAHLWAFCGWLGLPPSRRQAPGPPPGDGEEPPGAGR